MKRKENISDTYGYKKIIWVEIICKDKFDCLFKDINIDQFNMLKDYFKDIDYLNSKCLIDNDLIRYIQDFLEE